MRVEHLRSLDSKGIPDVERYAPLHTLRGPRHRARTQSAAGANPRADFELTDSLGIPKAVLV